MKRKYSLLVLFLIAVYLLSFTVVSYSNNNIPSPGEVWNNIFSADNKGSYIAGFQQGAQASLNKLSPTIAKFTDEGKVWDELCDFSKFMWDIDISTISKVMDELYKDPANTYIYAYNMINIACQKLKGEDVELLLQKARKEGLQAFKEKEEGIN